MPFDQVQFFIVCSLLFYVSFLRRKVFQLIFFLFSSIIKLFFIILLHITTILKEKLKKDKTNISLVETRENKSTLFQIDEKNKEEFECQNEKKLTEIIGKEKFENLLSIFNKKTPRGNDKKEIKENVTISTGEKRSSISETIKKRIETLFNSNKDSYNNKAYSDPVLEQKRKIEDEFSDDFSDEKENI